MTGDGHAGMPPLMVLKPGRTCVLSIRNETAWLASDAPPRPQFSRAGRNGAPVPHRQWGRHGADAREERPSRSPSSPTPWRLDAALPRTDHQVSGMMAVLRVG